MGLFSLLFYCQRLEFSIGFSSKFYCEHENMKYILTVRGGRNKLFKIIIAWRIIISETEATYLYILIISSKWREKTSGSQFW